MTDIAYPGDKPGHVVLHGERTILFTDGADEVNSFDPKTLADGKPTGRQYKTAQPHHGVAVEPADGALVVTRETGESRSGAIALDKDGKENACSEQRPGVHGEAVAQGEVVGLGCKDGCCCSRTATSSRSTATGRTGPSAPRSAATRPALFVRGTDAYITEPTTKKVHQLDLATGKVGGSVALDVMPNEISGTRPAH